MRQALLSQMRYVADVAASLPCNDQVASLHQPAWHTCKGYALSFASVPLRATANDGLLACSPTG